MKSRILWTTVDYTGSTYIELTEEAFRHLQKHFDQLPEGLSDTIEGNIVEPDMVVQSEKYEDTRIYSRRDVLGEEYRDHWFHVSVTSQSYSGSVTSAYASENVKKGKIIYAKIKR